MTSRERGIADYIRDISLREPDVLRRLRAESERQPHADWASPPEQAQLLALLAQATGAKRIVEVGTFTGYTTLALALAVPADGQIVTLDLEPEFAEIGKPFWQEAGVAERIELHIGDATGSLDALLATPGPGSFDMAYIDCNKKAYDAYYERCLALVRTGGLIGFDNMLWGGAVTDPHNREKSTVALHALNEKLHADPRVTISLLPIGDGLTLAWKRP